MEKPNDQRREGQAGGREPSDRWDFSSVPPPQSQIPQLKEIPETPEERRRRRIILAISAVLALIAVVTATVIALNIRHDSRIASSVEDYGATGRLPYLEEALDLLEGDDSPADRALRARLLATAALEQGQADATEGARTLLEGLAEDEAAREVAIARTYLALAAGEPRQAQQAAATIASGGDFPAEAARAQALAAGAVGALPQAVAFAETAVKERPEAPRHVALLGLLLARTGEGEQAVARLSELEDDAAASPAVRLARARIALRRGDMDVAAQQATELEGDETASPVERAWAELVLSYAAASRGDAAGALERLDKTAEHRPAGDEGFVLWRGRSLLRAGAVDEAGEELARLPEGVTSAPLVRSHVVAELALARGNPKAATAALEGAAEAGRTFLLRGWAEQGRGRSKAARSLYEKAAEDEATRAEAYAALARLELAEGREKAAVRAASKALTAGPANAAAVRAFVEAKLAAGDAKAAASAVDKALAQRPKDGRLLAARAAVEWAAEDWKAARETLAQAAARLPRDADLHARKGEAARRLGRADEAKKAFDRALELAPKHPMALAGLLQIHVAAEALDEAGKVLERIDEADVASVPIDRARARYHVLTAAGHAGISDVRRAIMRRAPSDPDLWLALAELQMQAGEHRGAVASYGRVMREREEDTPTALLGRAMAQLRMHSKSGAERTLDDLDEAVAEGQMDDGFRAGVLAARARLKLLDDRLGAARALARQALRADPRNAEAHLVLADVASERDRDPTEHLRAALKAPIPPPEAKGRLALELEEGDEQCALAEAYREAAPRGTHARRLARIVRACRRR
ncbi:MAG: tetratricopeptide repeat protein [Myxococcota bacterium]